MGQGEGEEDEIEAAFAAGAIVRTHPILRSRRLVRALCFLAGPLACLIAVSSGEAEGFVVSLLALGLVAVVTTPVIAVADECERRQAKKTREAARIVLNNFLLPPV
uniref:Uncharacterized protein n=1 Tax=Oryza brachyantha TaxID=4533 RepID=J3MZW2_ORYBR